MTPDGRQEGGVETGAGRSGPVGPSGEGAASGRIGRVLGWVWAWGCVATLAVPPPPVPVEREAAWRIVNLAADAGVSRRMVADVAFGRDGAAWLAVSDGLYRYDGYRWRRFTAADGLPSNFIRSVVVTRDGSLWVATDQGAGVFDGRTFDSRGTGGRLAGSSVRRIVETADGAIWFCCDRWPDLSQPGGLTRWRDGQAQTFGLAEGLPSDHLLGLFEQSNGRLIALTAGGPAVWQAGRWGPLADPGYPPEDYTWAMVESPDGRVFAQAFERTLTLGPAGWEPCDEPRSSSTAALCVHPDGTPLLLVQPRPDTIAFARWDGQSFAPASSTVTVPGVDEMLIRAAPDGAVWAVGRGVILRWEYLPGAWDWWPDLPGPVLEDGAGRVWFAGPRGAAYVQGADLHRVPALHSPVIEDSRGAIWAAGDAGVCRWAEGAVTLFPPEVCGITRLQGGVSGSPDLLLFHGQGVSGEPVVALRKGEAWIVSDSGVLGGREVLSLVPDPEGGVWAVLSDQGSRAYDVVRVTTGGIEVVPIGDVPPPVGRPRVLVTPLAVYLHGHAGVWRAKRGGSELVFEKLELPGGGVFTRGAGVGDMVSFIAQEGLGGSAVILLGRDGGWFQAPILYGQELWFGRDGWIMVADGAEFVLWQAREWGSPTFVSLPVDTTIAAMLRGRGGEYWLGTPQGVLRLRGGARPPETLLEGPDTLVAGASESVQARAVAAFAPRSASRRYSFAWRFDDGTWSGYGAWPAGGLSLAGLPPGRHVVEVRARDGLGHEDPTPARHEVVVQAVPIQDRRWFRPVLGALGLTFAGLSAALLVVGSRLRRQAGALQAEVAARTAELRQDIERRQRTEEELRRSDALLLAGSRIANLLLTEKDLAPAMAEVLRLLGVASGQDRAYVFELHTDPLTREVLASQRHEWVKAGVSTEETNPVLQNLPFAQLAPFSYGQLGQGRPVAALVRDLPPTEREVLEPQGIIAILLVPISVEGSVWGFIGFDNCHAPYEWSQAEQSALIAVGSSIGGAITRRRAEAVRERLQGQLVQAQKMESVGRLAGGVAHDFNNILQAILGHTALSLGMLPAGSPVQQHLEEVQHAALRSADLTRRLLAFARRQTVAPRVLDLNETVSGALRLLGRLMREDIQVNWRPGPALWPVCMDPVQVDQVLTNLCLNARDAIDGAGQVTITTEAVALDAETATLIPEAAPGRYVVLTVSDTGHGMDAEARSHIFEPFYTTKEQGKGTGLGLATVFGIVKQNRGWITVASEPGRGTTFRIGLPPADRVPAVEPTAPPPARPGAPQPAAPASATVLLVEDEEQILRLSHQILRQQGYQVLQAPSPEQALELVRTHPGRIDLLVTDVIMPGMNGRELRQRVEERHPALRCLYISGYTADVIGRQGVLDDGVEFLQKPFTIQDLTTRVEALLDRGARPPA